MKLVTLPFTITCVMIALVSSHRPHAENHGMESNATESIRRIESTRDGHFADSIRDTRETGNGVANSSEVTDADAEAKKAMDAAPPDAEAMTFVFQCSNGEQKRRIFKSGLIEAYLSPAEQKLQFQVVESGQIQGEIQDLQWPEKDGAPIQMDETEGARRDRKRWVRPLVQTYVSHSICQDTCESNLSNHQVGKYSCALTLFDDCDFRNVVELCHSYLPK